MEEITGGITAPEGFLAGGVRAGIKEEGNDIALIYSQKMAQAAAVFTTNQAAAAPVKISKEHCENGKAQAIIVNSGNANACTGEQGWKDAGKMVALTAQALDLDQEEVLVSSTGIIGHKLPIDKIERGIKDVCTALETDGSHQAAQAIMTTDTYLKEETIELKIAGQEVKIGGIAKGSGMIEPNMATMLSFVTTDVAIEGELLTKALQDAVDNSFNQITVDGDQSTNDMVGILANGQAENQVINQEDEEYQKFKDALTYICRKLARQIVKDGEGATKFVEINLAGATDKETAQQMVKKIANSKLVKTAIFGEDPNWGRIVAALGSVAGDMKLEELEVKINGQPVFGPNEEKYTISDDLLSNNEVVITVDLNLGDNTAQVWTCDLSYDYVEINAEYHT
ncbi:bifunctional glutamate N-acetyltransferase/amino-acid acetyltransferase ArgJ [Halanaerocella petrolearia]